MAINVPESVPYEDRDKYLYRNDPRFQQMVDAICNELIREGGLRADDIHRALRMAEIRVLDLKLRRVVELKLRVQEQEMEAT